MNETSTPAPTPTPEQQAQWDETRIQDPAKAHYVAIHGHPERTLAAHRRKLAYEKNAPSWFKEAEDADINADRDEDLAAEHYDPFKH